MIEIVPFTPADLPVIIDFVAAIQDHERALAPVLKPGAEIGADYAASLLEHVRARHGFMLLARADAEAVGFICGWPDHEDDALLTEAARPHGYISDLFVTASWRRRGVARALLEAAERALRGRGCRRLMICSKAGNLAALRTYEAMGFRAYEVILTKE